MQAQDKQGDHTRRAEQSDYAGGTTVGVAVESRVETARTAGLRELAIVRLIGAVLRIPYAPLPPAPRGRWSRVAIGIVTLMVVAFIVFFTAYASAQFDAYLTNAEDMGIMDQALWNTVHGALLHQTICNPISDSNCLGDIPRFAIHFEPIMLPLALLYVFAATPKALMLVQMVVVAMGAYPAYWIASRRLSSPLAGICFAAVYLTYPALESAVEFDFHAVTLSSAFLLFSLYYVLTYNNRGLFIAAILAMATKEEVPLDVLMIGLAVVCFQRRWRVGTALIVLACCWLGVAELVMHLASPLGHSPTAGRYAYLGNGPLSVVLFVLTHPLQLLRDQILGNGGIRYLQTLLTPVAYLAILAPMVWLLAAPPLLINLLSSDPNMHSGIHQYSAEIVPFMVFAGIAGAALLVAGVKYIESSVLFLRFKRTTAYVLSGWWPGIRSRVPGKSPSKPQLPVARVALVALVLLIVMFSARQQYRLSILPVTDAFIWPTVTAHARIADTLITHIPATASVSAQDTLVPHLSHRRFIYQYPYGADRADYVFLDTSSTATIYPFPDKASYTASVQQLQASGQMVVVAQQDGYLLLARAGIAHEAASDGWSATERGHNQVS